MVETASRFESAPALPGDVTELADLFRLDAARKLNPKRQAELGQFFTPAATARLMASMASVVRPHMRVLDPGAGIGSLTAAWVSEMCRRPNRPERVTVTAFEVDQGLAPYLQDTLAGCRDACGAAGIDFRWDLRAADFIAAGVSALGGGLFTEDLGRFDCAILNPPYKKIRTDSEPRRLLRTVGVETSNLYTAFLSLVVMLLEQGGELIAITPRSFCNGPYFRPFRRQLLARVSVDRIHVFEARGDAFREDDVLQENVIIHGLRGVSGPESVRVSYSQNPADPEIHVRDVPADRVVRPDDPDAFIHVVPDEWGETIAAHMAAMPCVLAELGLTVSTGRVVDFRARDVLRAEPGADTVPLIYPTHFAVGFIQWPKPGTRKPNAVAVTAESESLLVPAGVYVLVKRFSAKEERRRVVAAVYDPARVPGPFVGFENHLNYFHDDGGGLPPELALGLAAFLNSTLLDDYFRQFNGHTQVNATDLRRLRYPTRARLEALGRRIGETFPPQDTLDAIVEEELLDVATDAEMSDRAQRRVADALEILTAMGLPREQLNDRSALTLLALLELTPDRPWSAAANPLCRVTPIMDFAAEYYGKRYAPNTRETVRRYTLHQFAQAGLVVSNPDKPARATNSPAYCYQIAPRALELIRQYGTDQWTYALRRYLVDVPELARRYARERDMEMIPLTLASGVSIKLTPGGQNTLVEKIITTFCPRFTPGGYPVYVGDTGEKWAHFDAAYLASLGVTVESHGKMPDVVVHYTKKDWLVLIEAVTSHGPVSPKRRAELRDMFAGSRAGLVFVTAFLGRSALKKYLGDIAWETEVWVAEAPSHMLHFNGERFLGPYP